MRDRGCPGTQARVGGMPPDAAPSGDPGTPTCSDPCPREREMFCDVVVCDNGGL